MKLSELKSYNQSQKKLKPIYKMERRLNFKFMLVFAIIATIVSVLDLSVFPLMKKMLDTSQIPGMQLTDISQYFATSISQNLLVLGAIFAGYMGSSIISSNFKNKSATLLYTQNYSRTKIVLNKYLRVFLNIVLFTTIAFLGSVVAIAIIDFKSIVAVNYGILYLFTIVTLLIVGSLMFGITLFYNNLPSLYSIGITIILSIVSALSYISESLSFLKYVNPLSIIKNESGKNIMISGFDAINYTSLVLWCAICVVVVFAGIMSFKKKDVS